MYETGKFAAAFPSFSIDALEISYDPDVYNQWGLYNAEHEGYDISVCQAWDLATPDFVNAPPKLKMVF